MLTKVKAFTSWHSAPVMTLDDDGRSETDLIQIRNIDGLDPVKGSVNTAPLGSVDGASYSGTSINTRNIVLTLRPNPDWKDWTYESIRALLYQYFMPKRSVQLNFYSDDMVPVYISGIVESCEVNLFNKDPEVVVSVICPDPYFTALDPVILTGRTIPQSGNIGTVPTTINYNGTIEAGIFLKVTAHASEPAPNTIAVQIQDPLQSYFQVAVTVNSFAFFEMNSTPLKKYVRTIGIGSGVITNVMSAITIRQGSLWPILDSGIDQFSVLTDVGNHDWELHYSERYGGL